MSAVIFTGLNDRLINDITNGRFISKEFGDKHKFICNMTLVIDPLERASRGLSRCYINRRRTRPPDQTHPKYPTLSNLSSDMLTSIRLYTLATLTLISATFGAIGPIADLSIVNKVISPDGFPRSSVIFPCPTNHK